MPSGNGPPASTWVAYVPSVLVSPPSKASEQSSLAKAQLVTVAASRGVPLASRTWPSTQARGVRFDRWHPLGEDGVPYDRPGHIGLVIGRFRGDPVELGGGVQHVRTRLDRRLAL